MTADEYKQKLLDIKAEYIKKRNSLEEEFALANNTVEIGDIVSDGSSTIRVEKFGFITATSLPRVFYIGVRLTKKLKPYINGEKTSVFNVEKHIKKESDK